MTTPEVLHAAVLTLLRTISGLTVYDAGVPKGPPADDNGQVYPYAVAWPGGGAPAPETDVAAQRPVTGIGPTAWSTQITVAAGATDWALDAVADVLRVLHLAPLAPGVLLVKDPSDVPMQRDPDTTPVRWFVPLRFTCLTP